MKFVGRSGLPKMKSDGQTLCGLLKNVGAESEQHWLKQFWLWNLASSAWLTQACGQRHGCLDASSQPNSFGQPNQVNWTLWGSVLSGGLLSGSLESLAQPISDLELDTLGVYTLWRSILWRSRV